MATYSTFRFVQASPFHNQFDVPRVFWPKYRTVGNPQGTLVLPFVMETNSDVSHSVHVLE